MFNVNKTEAFITSKLKEAGLQKITFAGGAPLLYKWIYEVIVYSKDNNLKLILESKYTIMMSEEYFLLSFLLDIL